MARLLAVGGAEALVLRPRLLQRLLALLDLAARVLQVGLRAFFFIFLWPAWATILLAMTI